VTADALTETAHLVQASVTDDTDSTGMDSQVMTVDVTVPVLTIDGGPTRSTSDTSPWTYGTTAEQAGTIVHVELGGQSLTAIVEAGGTWGVSAQSVAWGTYRVLATTTDAARNTGSMSQILQIGTVVTTPDGPRPPVGFDGGATQETSDTTPTISGVTDEPGHPTVVVTVGGQTLTTTAYRPDAEVRVGGRAFVGRGSFSVSRQRVTSTLNGRRARTATSTIRVTNRGDAADSVAIRGTRSSKHFTVAYLQGRKNVTAAVLKGTYRTGTCGPGSRPA
jgi:hypothetical protein